MVQTTEGSIMRLFYSCIVAVICICLATVAWAADPGAGRKQAARQCQTCHGIDGIAKIPIAPHLAGESQIYLDTQLKAFRSGKRVHEMMTVVAKDLSDAEISNLSAWYASIKISVEVPE